jgi:hypothetical protein
VAHTGGVLPYLKRRIAAYGRSSPLVTEPPRLSRPIGDYLANPYVDTVCYHYEALACCYQVLGAEHVLFGTDHPLHQAGVQGRRARRRGRRHEGFFMGLYKGRSRRRR